MTPYSLSIDQAALASRAVEEVDDGLHVVVGEALAGGDGGVGELAEEQGNAKTNLDMGEVQADAG